MRSFKKEKPIEKFQKLRKSIYSPTEKFPRILEKDKDKNLNFEVAQKIPTTIFSDKENIINIRRILKTEESKRSVEDTSYIIKIMKQGNFFKNFNVDNYIHGLLSIQKLDHYPKKNSIIFSEGDIGDNFYIILVGSVIGLQNSTEVVLDEFKIEPKQIFKLYQGESFGELALIFGDNKRTCTIKTCEPTEVICIPKKNFQLLIEKGNNSRIDEVLEAYRLCKLFRGLGNSLINKLATRSTIERYPPNTLIIRQHETNYHILLLKKGSLNVLRKIRKHEVEGKEILQKKFSSEYANIKDEMIMEIKQVHENDCVCDYEIINQVPMVNSIITILPCEIIMLSMYELLEWLSNEQIKFMQNSVNLYPNDYEVLESHLKNLNWNKVKNCIVQNVIYDKFQKKNLNTQRDNGDKIFGSKNSTNISKLFNSFRKDKQKIDSNYGEIQINVKQRIMSKGSILKSTMIKGSKHVEEQEENSATKSGFKLYSIDSNEHESPGVGSKLKKGSRKSIDEISGIKEKDNKNFLDISKNQKIQHTSRSDQSEYFDEKSNIKISEIMTSNKSPTKKLLEEEFEGESTGGFYYPKDTNSRQKTKILDSLKKTDLGDTSSRTYIKKQNHSDKGLASLKKENISKRQMDPAKPTKSKSGMPMPKISHKISIPMPHIKYSTPMRNNNSHSKQFDMIKNRNELSSYIDYKKKEDVPDSEYALPSQKNSYFFDLKRGAITDKKRISTEHSPIIDRQLTKSYSQNTITQYKRQSTKVLDFSLHNSSSYINRNSIKVSLNNISSTQNKTGLQNTRRSMFFEEISEEKKVDDLNQLSNNATDPFIENESNQPALCSEKFSSSEKKLTEQYAHKHDQVNNDKPGEVFHIFKSYAEKRLNTDSIQNIGRSPIGSEKRKTGLLQDWDELKSQREATIADVCVKALSQSQIILKAIFNNDYKNSNNMAEGAFFKKRNSQFLSESLPLKQGNKSEQINNTEKLIPHGDNSKKMVNEIDWQLVPDICSMKLNMKFTKMEPREKKYEISSYDRYKKYNKGYIDRELGPPSSLDDKKDNCPS